MRTRPALWLGHRPVPQLPDLVFTVVVRQNSHVARACPRGGQDGVNTRVLEVEELGSVGGEVKNFFQRAHELQTAQG